VTVIAVRIMVRAVVFMMVDALKSKNTLQSQRPVIAHCPADVARSRAAGASVSRFAGNRIGRLQTILVVPGKESFVRS
jgi:hypothetical protein